MWLRLMLIAFVANGLGPFGLKVLAEKRLSESYHYQYLVFWYGGGFLLALSALLVSRLKPRAWEAGLAALMGLGSFGGQLFSALALERDIPGHIVFPLTTGGNLFLVSAAGVLLFKERIGPYGIAGILAGIAALGMLSVA